jgi:cytochrome P450
MTRSPKPAPHTTAEVRGWDRCRAALGKSGLTCDPRLAGVEPIQPNNLLFMDGEPHRRLRALIVPYFAGHRLERLASQLETTCRDALATALPDPGANLVDDLVEPLVLDAIFSAMAVPAANRDRLGVLCGQMIGLLEPDLPAAARQRSANAAMRATMSFDRDRRRGVASGLHADLERAAAAGTIPAKLARSTPVVVLHGGYENPLNQLGCVVAYAVENPERFKRAAASAPDLLFEEVLRAYSPVRAITRWVADDGDGERRRRKGDLVWISLESANRDPDRFPAAAEVDLSKRRPHVGFGHGAHACLGTALARLEGRVLISALASVPDAVLGEFSVAWRTGVVAHGPERISRGEGLPSHGAVAENRDGLPPGVFGGLLGLRRDRECEPDQLDHRGLTRTTGPN